MTYPSSLSNIALRSETLTLSDTSNVNGLASVPSPAIGFIIVVSMACLIDSGIVYSGVSGCSGCSSSITTNSSVLRTRIRCPSGSSAAKPTAYNVSPTLIRSFHESISSTKAPPI